MLFIISSNLSKNIFNPSSLYKICFEKIFWRFSSPIIWVIKEYSSNISCDKTSSLPFSSSLIDSLIYKELFSFISGLYCFKTVGSIVSSCEMKLSKYFIKLILLWIDVLLSIESFLFYLFYIL